MYLLRREEYVSIRVCGILPPTSGIDNDDDKALILILISWRRRCGHVIELRVKEYGMTHR